MAEVMPDDLEKIVDVKRRCEISRDTRRTVNRACRTLYELGSDSTVESSYNKIWAHIDRLASYVYAPGTLRFEAVVPTAHREHWVAAAAVARDEQRQVWFNSGADLVAAMLVEWAFVYGATIGKLAHDPTVGYSLDYVDPGDFGVLQEDQPDLDVQPAFAHWYAISIPQIEQWIRDTPRESELLAMAHEHKTSTPRSGGSPGLVVAGISGTFPNTTVTAGFPGNADILSSLTDASVDEPTVTFVDVWEQVPYQHRRRRRVGPSGSLFYDWRVTTLIAGADMLFVQRRNPVIPWTRTSSDTWLPGEHPFVLVCPRPQPAYFWGRSEIRGLRGLQRGLDKIDLDTDAAVAHQLDPSRFYSGVPAVDEAERAMATPGGSFSSQDPGAKLQEFKPTIGDEVFRVRQQKIAAFADMSGVPESLGEPGTIPGGVRSTGQFSQVAGIAAGRIRKMALYIEDALAQMATKGLRICQRHDTQAYSVRGGSPFLLSQLPVGVSLKVDSHSGAPIFAEQRKSDAMVLRKGRAISAPNFVRMIGPMNEDELVEDARKIEESQAKMAQEEMQIKAEKARGTGRRRQ